MEVPINETRIAKALAIAHRFSQIDGAHHKAWAIDQMVRALLDDSYANWVRNYEHDRDTGEYYRWDIGIAP